MNNALEDTALHLPMKERANLALKLLSSLDALDEAEFDRVWGEESARRVASGAAAIPGEVVAEKARALLR